MRAWIVMVIAVGAGGTAAGADEKPSYIKNVKPMFAESCVRCHRPGNKKAGLDMTTVAMMLQGGKRGKKMLVPGEPDKSRVLTTMEGHGKLMPPRREKDRPTKEQIAAVRAWIAAGAKDDSAASPRRGER